MASLSVKYLGLVSPQENTVENRVKAFNVVRHVALGKYYARGLDTQPNREWGKIMATRKYNK
jgi:hypothetical protein